MKVILIVLGSLFIVIGCIGLIIPGLPATPFFLLSAAFFLRGNQKLYDLLIKSPFLGKRLRNFHAQGGMTLKTKICAISLMWSMILFSIIITHSILLLFILPAVGLIGTVVMGFIIKTAARHNASCISGNTEQRTSALPGSQQDDSCTVKHTPGDRG